MSRLACLWTWRHCLPNPAAATFGNSRALLPLAAFAPAIKRPASASRRHVPFLFLFSPLPTTSLWVMCLPLLNDSPPHSTTALPSSPTLHRQTTIVYVCPSLCLWDFGSMTRGRITTASEYSETSVGYLALRLDACNRQFLLLGGQPPRRLGSVGQRDESH